MANQVNSPKPTSQATLASATWQAAMGNYPAAASRRRWAGLIIALLLTALLLFQAPASPSVFVRWLFSARSYGHLLALGLGFFLALRTAASSQQAIFQLEGLKEAQKHIWRSAFGGRQEPLNVGNDPSKLTRPENSFLPLGGPRQIQLPREHIAVVEDFEGNSRVVSREGETLLRGFEHLRALIEAKDQVAIISLWGRTRDGIRVQVDSARIVYSIRRVKTESSLPDSQRIDDEPVLRVAYEKRIESEKALIPEYTAAMDDYGPAFFERQMQSFIAGLGFGELLSSPAEKGEADAENGKALTIKREMLKEAFANYSETASLKQGLQTHWVDMGRWTVDELAQEIIDDQRGNPLHSSSVGEKASYQDSRADELKRLYSELAALDWAKTTNEEAPNQSRLLAAYYGLFDGLNLRYGELMGKDAQQIDIVLRFLKVINSRPERKQ